MGIGLLIFVLMAVMTMIFRGNFLQYPVAQAGTLILVIETAATISIAMILTILFIGGNPTVNPTEKDESRKASIVDKENTTK